MAKVHVVFYSMYGHVWRMAEAVAVGARSVGGTDVAVLQVAETLPREVLDKMHATQAKQAFAHVPIARPEQLVEADAIIFGIPTRYGSTPAQMQAFLDATGQLWAKGALIGKVGSAFTSTATQHGGHETTIISFSSFLYHQGMVIVGCPYAAKGLSVLDEISGGSPYGAGTIAGSSGERQPSANELEIARFQGAHVARIAAALVAAGIGR
ncbi:MAG TPA: NAD(P)H:quinone oxidoreductase [Planctomycetota bacterium]|nr:NAD(P)H:quinone oxidoreductase [Planctomycetota bacterium]